MALLALSPIMLTSCDAEPEGEPVMRTRIGSGVAEGTVEEAPDGAGEAEPSLAKPKGDSDCKTVTFEGVKLTHCIADPAKHRISTALNGTNNKPFRSLANLAGSRATNAKPIAFAMNGGMYGDEGQPIGYYVENKDRKSELSLTDGPGNFHLKPNGVFYGTGGAWRVRQTPDFYRLVGDRPEFGTQSGPMLVIEGKLHPEISHNGPSRTRRNGVGVDAAGRAHFVISEDSISFGQFARFFRDTLKTPNALYLDGSISALWDPANERMDSRSNLGPLIVVELRK